MNKIKAAGLTPVSIARYPMRGYAGQRFIKLAPSVALFRGSRDGVISDEEYTRQFKADVLTKLDPVTVARDLDGCVLMCWEPPGEFCHRRLVAEWLEAATGQEVPEFDTATGQEKQAELL